MNATDVQGSICSIVMYHKVSSALSVKEREAVRIGLIVVNESKAGTLRIGNQYFF